jgi:hypothetical protein
VFSREAQRWSSGFSLRNWMWLAELVFVAQMLRASIPLRQQVSTTVKLRRLKPELQLSRQSS